MSDLIIKPSGTSANFKVQNPSGTDKIVMNSSGTITTGTLGSGVTFPAGMVLQVVSAKFSLRVTVTSTSFNTDDVLGSLQITPKVASSNILLTAFIVMNVNSSGAYMYGDFYKNASDVTETANLSGHTHGLSSIDDGAGWTQISYMFLDTCSENSLSQKTYKTSARLHNSGTGTLGWENNTNMGHHLLAQEIAV